MKLIPAAYQLSLNLFRSIEISRPVSRAAPAEPSYPKLDIIWRKLQVEFFPELDVLNGYRVVWSARRHRSTLASCNVERLKVVVAPVMKYPPADEYLEALLYHEMCHAALGKPKIVRGRRCVHGRDFKFLERRHPGIPALNGWIRSGGWSAAVKKYNRGPGRRTREKNLVTKIK